MGGTAPYEFTLSPGNVTNQSGIFTGLYAGSYSIQISDANLCTTGKTITLTEPANGLSLTEVVSSHVNISCNGLTDGQFEISGSGGSGNFEYSLDGSTWTSSGLFTALSPGDYNPVVRDQQSTGCVYTLSAPVTITEPAAVGFLSQAATDVTCNGDGDGTITVNATGGTGVYTYTLSPLSTTNSDGAFDALAPGSYTVAVVDENNCPATSDPLSISEPDQLVITGTSSVDLNCYDAGNGTITIAATGGTTPYAFTLSPGDIINDNGQFTGLNAGTYQATITDANGCGPLVTGSIDLAQPDEILISKMSTQDVTIAGGNDGMISVTATGGTGSLLFSINGNPSQTISLFENLYPGDYTIAISDENGCGPVYSSVIPINEPTSITPVAGSLKGMIYPNPAKRQFTIELEGIKGNNCFITLVNMQGQKVYNKTYPVAADRGLQEIIDPGDIPSGIYLIRVNEILLKEKLVIR